MARHRKQVQQKGKTGCQRADLRALETNDQVTFPVTRNRTIRTLAGRSQIMILSDTKALPLPFRRARGTRKARPERKQVTSSRRSAPRP